MNSLRNRKIWLALAAAVLAAVAVVGLVAPTADGGARLIHEEPSEFETVLVYEFGGQRCLNFGSVDTPGSQTCFLPSEPDKMVFEYTRMMTSGLLARPAPANILVIGLGGGTLPTALARLLPDAVIDTVEIDPAVIKVAQAYFGYEPGPRQRVFVADGREFVERARREGRTYDMVMLDAFGLDYIPAHLLTVEFLEQVKAVLSGQGLLVANSFTRSSLYNRESATYAAVFGSFFNLRGRLDGNRVIIASPAELPSDEELAQNAAALAGPLAQFGIDASAALDRFSRTPERPSDAEPLRDGPGAG